MSTYISVSDVTDSISEGIDLEPYLMEADDAIEDLAERLGVREATDIETAPIHYKVKRYGIAYALMRMCQDRIAKAQSDTIPEQNKYSIMYGLYRRELKELDGSISAEMMTGDVQQIRDRANNMTAVLYRG